MGETMMNPEFVREAVSRLRVTAGIIERQPESLQAFRCVEDRDPPTSWSIHVEIHPVKFTREDVEAGRPDALAAERRAHGETRLALDVALERIRVLEGKR
jgi:hypothetical protein